MKKSDKLQKVVDNIIHLLYSDRQEDGVFENTRWRMTGYGLNKEYITGCLELACAKEFDKWDNSRSIIIKLEHLRWEHKSDEELANIVEHLFGVF